jgi:integrase
VISLMFAAALRPDEAVKLKRADVTVDEWVDENTGKWSAIMYVLIQKSKTNQGERRGDVVVVGSCEDKAICPHYWYCNYQLWWGESEYLFSDERGKKLSPSTPRSIIKQTLDQCGIDSKRYGGHSARKGAATAAVAAGVDMNLLKRHGRWKSDAVYVYVHDSIENKLSVSKAITSFTEKHPNPNRKGAV